MAYFGRDSRTDFNTGRSDHAFSPTFQSSRPIISSGYMAVLNADY